MKPVLVISDVPKTNTFVRFALTLLGVRHDMVMSLAEAAKKLERGAYGAAIIDLRWPDRAVLSLASWVEAHLTRRGIRPVLGAETPLARNLQAAVLVPRATFLRRSFDLLDLKEAIGESEGERTAVRHASAG